jgi:hypothetical protein
MPCIKPPPTPRLLSTHGCYVLLLPLLLQHWLECGGHAGLQPGCSGSGQAAAVLHWGRFIPGHCTGREVRGLIKPCAALLRTPVPVLQCIQFHSISFKGRLLSGHCSGREVGDLAQPCAETHEEFGTLGHLCLQATAALACMCRAKLLQL